MASKTLTPQEQMKEYKREIDRACRELDRERRKMEMQQTRLEGEIRKSAKAGQMGPVRIMARDHVRGKKQIQTFYQLRTNLQGVGLQLQTMKSIDAMANAMKNATRAMVSMGRRLNMPQLQGVMRTFGVETERMEMTQEVMADTLDGVLEGEDEEAAADEMVSRVMTELNLSMGDAMAKAPLGAGMRAAAPAAAAPARVAAAEGAAAGAGGGAAAGAGGGAFPPPPGGGGPGAGAGGGGGGDGGGGGMAAPPPSGPTTAAGTDLQARLAALKKD